VFGRFSGIVYPVFGKFYRKTMIRTPVQTGDKTSNNLRSNEFEIIELFIADNIFELVHGYKPEKIKKRL
jgi:hypothetical protein